LIASKLYQLCTDYATLLYKRPLFVCFVPDVTNYAPLLLPESVSRVELLSKAIKELSADSFQLSVSLTDG
jgi:hypothetical protein